jgi:hypothetical protein
MHNFDRIFNANSKFMKTKIYLFAVLTICIVLNACEPLTNSTENIAAKLEGQWKCEEVSTGFKSTDDFYYVTINIHPLDSNKILIENFYDLGSSSNITANINGMSLTIPNQTTSEGSTISGSGTISKKFDEIKWTYKVDIGDGSVADVAATYTRSY